jgi:hypothetical protein
MCTFVSHHLDKPDSCFRTVGEETMRITNAHTASLPPTIRIIASNWSNSGTAPYGPLNVTVARQWGAAAKSEIANETDNIAVAVVR